jgi:uncharacterized YccA/Bax inhibitor family protein
MRSGNPVLGENTFLDIGSGTVVGGSSSSGTMTLSGTINKTAILLALMVMTAAFVWDKYEGPQSVGAIMPWLWTGLVGGLVLALVTTFKQAWAPVTAPAYALVEGLFLGAISVMFEARFPGIVMQAVSLTICTLAALLMAYRSGLIRATENFKLGVVAATGGIMLVYLVNIGMRMFGSAGMPFIHESGWMAIGFSLFVIVIAALNLVLDFDFIENGAEQGAPKYMEWYGAFGLMVTLVWLYIEFLRLLSKLRD